MGLSIDKWFYDVLRDSDVYTKTMSRIFNTARCSADEDEDKVPYVIITHEGLKNSGFSKDGVEGEDDNVPVGVLVVANTREELASIAQSARLAVRLAVCEMLLHGGGMDYTFSAGKVQYDQMKPCYWQDLRWECVVEN